MYSILIALHVIVCVLLTVTILLQSSKGGGLAGTFGGSGAMGSVFGGRGAATFLSKLTTGLAVTFMLLALLLGFITRGDIDKSSLVAQERERQVTSQSRTIPQVMEEGQVSSAALPTEMPDAAASGQTEQSTPVEE